MRTHLWILRQWLDNCNGNSDKDANTLKSRQSVWKRNVIQELESKFAYGLPVEGYIV